MDECSQLLASKGDYELKKTAAVTPVKNIILSFLKRHKRLRFNGMQVVPTFVRLSAVLLVLLGTYPLAHGTEGAGGTDRRCEAIVSYASTEGPATASFSGQRFPGLAFAEAQVAARPLPAEELFRRHLASHLIDAAYRNSDGPFHKMADRFQRVAMRQAERMVKSVSGIRSWQRTHEGDHDRRPIIEERDIEVTWDGGDGEQTYSVTILVVNTELLGELLAADGKDWEHLQGVSPAWLNFFGDPHNVSAVERLLVRYLDAESNRKQTGKAIPKNIKDPRTLSHLDLVKEVIKLRVHEVALEHQRQAMSEGRLAAGHAIAAARQVEDQPHPIDQAICDAATRCIVDVVAMVDALEHAMPLDLIAFLEDKAAQRQASASASQTSQDRGKRGKGAAALYEPYRKEIEQWQREAEERGSHLIPSVTNGEGALGLVLPQYQAAVGFDRLLGTLVVESSKGRYSKPKGPLVILNHGIGTERSNALSWLTVLAKLLSYISGNPVAPDDVRSGLGLRFEDPRFEALAGYSALQVERLLEQMISEVGEGMIAVEGQRYAPIWQVGRSFGSTRGLFHDYEDPYNRVDVRLLTSFSNPLTLKEQIEFVHRQAELGITNDIDMDILRFMTVASDRFMAALDDQTPQAILARQLFALAQMNSVYLISRSDEDGGDAVLQEHKRFVTEYSPFSHTLFLADPLLGTSFADPQWPGYLSWFNLLESKHFILNPNKDPNPGVGESLFPGLPMELLPKPENQLKQATTLSYAMMDWQIEMEDVFRRAALHTKVEQPQISAMFEHLADKARRLRLYRGEYLPEGVETFFDAMAFSFGIKPDDLARAVSERQSFQQTRNQIRKEFIAYEEALDAHIQQHTGLSRRDFVGLTMSGALYKFESITEELIADQPHLATLIETFTGMRWQDFPEQGIEYHNEVYNEIHRMVSLAEVQLREVHLKTSSGMSWEDYVHLDLAQRFDMIRRFVTTEQARVTRLLTEASYLPQQP